MIETIEELQKQWEFSLSFLVSQKPIGVPRDINPELAFEADIHERAIETIKRKLVDYYNIFAGSPSELDEYVIVT